MEYQTGKEKKKKAVQVKNTDSVKKKKKKSNCISFQVSRIIKY